MVLGCNTIHFMVLGLRHPKVDRIWGLGFRGLGFGFA